MVPPKYKFYIGKKSFESILYPNQKINPITGQYEDSHYSTAYNFASRFIDISKAHTIFIDFRVDTSVYEDAYTEKIPSEYLYPGEIYSDPMQGLFFGPANYYCLYDKDENYIGCRSISKFHLGDYCDNMLLDLPSNAHYIAFNLLELNTISLWDILDTGFVYTLSTVNPHYDKLSKKYTKESDQVFFRASLDGKLNLFGNDFELIGKSRIVDSFLFFITKFNRLNGDWPIYYKGKFNKTDCILDYARNKCELKVSTYDSYEQILNKYDNTYDIIKIGLDSFNISYEIMPVIQVYLLGSKTVTNFFNTTYQEYDVKEAQFDANVLDQTYHFSRVGIINELRIDAVYNLPQEVQGIYAGTVGYVGLGEASAGKIRLYSSNGKYYISDGFSHYYNNDPAKTAYFYIGIYEVATNKLLARTANVTAYPDTIGQGYHYITNGVVEQVGTQIGGLGTGYGMAHFTSWGANQVFTRLVCNRSSIDTDSGAMATYDIPQNDFVSDNRNFKKCIGIASNILYSSQVVNSETKYGKNEEGLYFTDNILGVPYGARALPVNKSAWINVSIWLVYSEATSSTLSRATSVKVNKDCTSIGRVIRTLLKKICPTVRYEPTPEYSEFLQSNTNPLGLERFFICLTQKTNILKGDYDEAAQKGEISLKNIFDMLRDCFRCYWYIEDNKLKIEHISFFNNGLSYSKTNNYQFDFTKDVDAFNKKHIEYFQSEVEYDKSDLAARYEFSFMDNASEAFDGVTLDVLKAPYVQEDKTNKISIENFSSDIRFMHMFPDRFSNDGFALLCPVMSNGEFFVPTGKLTLLDENKRSYVADVQNCFASWAYLQKLYMWDFPSEYLQSNIMDVQVKEVKKCMSHTIEFQAEEDPATIGTIKTSFGNGVINALTIDLDTRHVKAVLIYTPE